MARSKKGGTTRGATSASRRAVTPRSTAGSDVPF